MANLPNWGFPMGEMGTYFGAMRNWLYLKPQPYVSDIGSSKHQKSVSQKKKEIAKRRKKNKRK